MSGFDSCQRVNSAIRHSSSGSHERYKSKSRLEWEKI